MKTSLEGLRRCELLRLRVDRTDLFPKINHLGNRKGIRSNKLPMHFLVIVKGEKREIMVRLAPGIISGRILRTTDFEIVWFVSWTDGRAFLGKGDIDDHVEFKEAPVKRLIIAEFIRSGYLGPGGYWPTDSEVEAEVRQREQLRLKRAQKNQKLDRFQSWRSRHSPKEPEESVPSNE